ncbi:hypothetical protein SDC9_103711 [bioreactor metagenome]|uniref:Uncharacterized protein n=1 Tax=bioreactor metagenome TaxID=1076179 RepID=A0A645B593_9ZZZZ|nr:hypothetical protein [Oscillibacter sp.]
MLQKGWFAAVLCVALVLLASALGVLAARMNGLQEQLSESDARLGEACEQLDGRIDGLEQTEKEPVLSYSAELGGMDLQRRRVTIHVALTTDRDIREEHPWLVVNGFGPAGKFDWTDMPFSSGPDGTGYSADFELPMDAAALELVLRTDGGERVLQTCSSVADLLPGRLLNCMGEVLYNAERGQFYQAEWSAELPTPDADEAAFRLYKNGKLLAETPCKPALPRDAGGGGSQTFLYWDTADGQGRPVEPGDEMELHFSCADEYGVGYEYPVGRWQITDTYAVASWPQAASPTLTWPKK